MDNNMDLEIKQLKKKIINLEQQFMIFQQEMLDMIDNLADTIMPEE